MTARWVMLAVIFLTRLSMGLQFQSVASVAPFLAADFRATYAEVGWLMGLFLLPGAVIALPGGMLGRRFGERRIVLVALALMTVGATALARSDGLGAAAAARLVSGVGGVLLNVMLAKMVADWFTGRELATAMGIMLAAWPAGIGVAVASLGALAGRSSWRTAVGATAVAAAGALVLMVVGYRAPRDLARTAGPRLRLPLPARELALAVIAGGGWSAFNASFIVLVSFAPALLMARGAPVETAGLLVSLGMWVSLGSVPLGGILADRVRHPDRVIVAGCLATAVPMLAIATLPGAALWFVLVGVMVGLAPGAMLALLPHTLRPEHLATGLGFYYAVYYLGVAVAQPAAGWLRDVTGNPAMPIFFAVVVLLATVLFHAAFRLVGGGHPGSEPRPMAWPAS